MFGRLLSLALLTIYYNYRVSYALLYLRLHVLDGFLHPLEFLITMHPLQATAILVLDGLVNCFSHLLLIPNLHGGEHHRDVISPFLGFIPRTTREKLTLRSFLLIRRRVRCH